jgi:hypothetical protein
MRHSVLCRAEEIQQWAELAPSDMADELDKEYYSFIEALENPRLPVYFKRSAERLTDHLQRWSGALRRALGA